MSLVSLSLFENIDIVLAFISFCLISSTTPGPNNLMIVTSSMNFGFKKTIPHMGGIVFGFGSMLVVIAIAKSGLIRILPDVQGGLKIIGSAYLLYLSYRIASNCSINSGNRNMNRPFTWIEAGIFQWVNPKAWTGAVSAMITYGSVDTSIPATVFIIIVFMVTTLIAVSLWGVFGGTLRRFLNTPKRLKYFNITMGLLLALSIIPIVTMDV